MKLLFYIIALIWTIFSCSNAAGQNQILNSQKNISLVIPTDSSTLYFPSQMKPFLNSWYSNMLFALHEPILSTYSGNQEIFRFTWLRTFHKPVAIRIQKNGDTISLTTKVSSGAGGYSPGQIIVDTTFTISLEQWQEFIKKFNAINFENFPPMEEKMRGTDGSEWILESMSNIKYHFATRWMARYDNYGRCCAYLLKLSQLKIPKDEQY